jgi:hypothetical protein
MSSLIPSEHLYKWAVVGLLITLSCRGVGQDRDDILKTASGNEFIRACRELVRPMHAPNPNVFDSANKILFQRLPTLQREDRKTCLKALAVTVRGTKEEVEALKALWREGDAELKRDTFRPLMIAVLRSRDLAFVGDLLNFFNSSETLLFESDQLSALYFLLDSLKDSAQHKDILTKTLRHLENGVIGGKLSPIALPEALKCAAILKTSDEYVSLCYQAFSGRSVSDSEVKPHKKIEAFKKLIRHPTRGVTSAIVAYLYTDMDLEIRTIAHTTITDPKLNANAVDLDDFYLSLIRSDTLSWGAIQKQDLGLRYLRLEIERDAKDLISRLKKKKVIFTEDELTLIRGRGIDGNFVAEFKGP